MVSSITQAHISNGFSLDMCPNRLGDLLPTDATASIADIREQLKPEGGPWR